LLTLAGGFAVWASAFCAGNQTAIRWMSRLTPWPFGPFVLLSDRVQAITASSISPLIRRDNLSHCCNLPVTRYFGYCGDDAMLIADYIAIIVLLALIGVAAALSERKSTRL
jgi:hypothetical protein